MANPKLSHHALFIVNKSVIPDLLISFIEKNLGIRQIGNPDFFKQVYETFSIDDAREIKKLHGTRPVTESGKKIFILRMNGITVEAQNALLKLFEEPADYAHFFVIIPSAHLLLPTVKSRMMELRLDADEAARSDLGGELAKKLLKLSKTKRLLEIKNFVDDISKDKKTKQDAIELLNDLQKIIYTEKGARKGKIAHEAIDLARNYMHDRSPSTKMLLEYVMLNLD